MTIASPIELVVDGRPGERSVEALHRSTDFHWVGDGFRVATYFPGARLPAERVSPFLLMDYGPPRDVEPSAQGKRGVGWHPHRGFETVTLAWEGSVAHRDNAGHVDVIGPGDAQWMTAARGIFHEEYLAEDLVRRGGRVHMMQLWVNLPRAHKMAEPGYQAIQAERFPVVALEKGGAVRVVAGEHAGQRGPARTFTRVTVLDATIKAGERAVFDLPQGDNALAVVVDGRVAAGGRLAEAGTLVLFANDGERATLAAENDAHVLLLSGEPIREPIVQYGPFVMNSVDEIRQAIADVNRGAFGPVPD